MQFFFISLLSYVNYKTILLHFVKDIHSHGKKYKKCLQAQKLEMADESPIWRRKHFFSDQNFKNDNFSKKTSFLYFLTKNTTYVAQFFFQKLEMSD
jgi:hypothetical protein